MIIDLTHVMHNGMTVYPGTLEPTFNAHNSIARDGFAELHLSLCTHTGTHIDAPSHIIAGARSLSDFDIDYFFGPATLIDVSGESIITLERLRTAESLISRVDFVLLRTGWQHWWSSERYFSGFPVLTAEAANWLAAMNLHGVGLDAISIDRVDDADLPNHNALLGSETLIIENLTNLEKITAEVFEFHCMPLNIQGGDGSPVRAWCKTPA